MSGMEPAPKATKITVHVEYDDGTSADMEAVEPAHVSIGAEPPGRHLSGYCTISILPAADRPLTVSGSAVEREQQHAVERWLENSAW